MGKELVPVKKNEIAAPASPEVFDIWRKKHKFRFGAGVAHAAAYEGRADIVRHMLRDHDLRDAVYRAFYRAASQDNVRVLQGMIDGGIDVNAKTKEKSAIMQAAANFATESVDLLLGHGADPDTRGKDGWTPLMWSAYINDYHSAQILLKAGADPSLKNNQGRHAAAIAHDGQNSEVFGLITMAQRIKTTESSPHKTPALPAPKAPELPKGWKVIDEDGVEMAVQMISKASAAVFITNVFDFKGKRLMTQFSQGASGFTVSDKRFADVEPELVQEARDVFELSRKSADKPVPGGLM